MHAPALRDSVSAGGLRHSRLLRVCALLPRVQMKARMHNDDVATLATLRQIYSRELRARFAVVTLEQPRAGGFGQVTPFQSEAAARGSGCRVRKLRHLSAVLPKPLCANTMRMRWCDW